MDRKRIMAIVLAVLLVGLIGLKFYMSTNSTNESTNVSEDAKKFKTEYESLNNTKDSNGNEYLSLSIEDNNNIVYKNAKEIIDILKKETGVIYFGTSSNIECRMIIETLLASVKDNNLGRIYYVDINNLEETDKNQILDIIKDKYDIQDFNSPILVGVKEGVIVSFHEGTVDNHNDTNNLDENEKKELYKIYNSIIQETLDTSCEQEQEQGC